MAKERICSTCGQHGHNARSCGLNNNHKKDKEICLKLFGFDRSCGLNNPKKNKDVCLELFEFDIHDPQNHESLSPAMSSSEKLEPAAMRKSKSTPGDIEMMDQVDAGYVSDGPAVQERKKGVPWTEEEHDKFLYGLQNLGPGNWKGISKNYVHSRTATQVASHAQKHFKRQNLPDKRNRRHSVFDKTLNEPEISNSTPPEHPDNTKEKVPRLVDNMHALNMSQKVVNEEQVENMLALNMSPKADFYAKAARTPLPSAPVLPYAPSYGVPNLNQNPYFPMMVMANNGQIYLMGKPLPGIPSTPMMYNPNAAFSYIQQSPGSQAPTSLVMPNFVHGSSSTIARP